MRTKRLLSLIFALLAVMMLNLTACSPFGGDDDARVPAAIDGDRDDDNDNDDNDGELDDEDDDD